MLQWFSTWQKLKVRVTCFQSQLTACMSTWIWCWRAYLCCVCAFTVVFVSRLWQKVKHGHKTIRRSKDEWCFCTKFHPCVFQRCNATCWKPWKHGAFQAKVTCDWICALFCLSVVFLSVCMRTYCHGKVEYKFKELVKEFLVLSIELYLSSYCRNETLSWKNAKKQCCKYVSAIIQFFFFLVLHSTTNRNITVGKKWWISQHDE